MYITVSQLANCINNCKRLNHYKVYFEIVGKPDPFIWFTFAPDYETAKKQASSFLHDELEKGFYKSGMILTIKQI